MHPSVHCNNIYSSRTWKKPKCPLVDEWIKKMYCVCPWKKSYDQPRQHIEKQRHYLADKGPCSQSYGFSSSHVWMQELDHKESWAPKNGCFWAEVLEKTLESPLDCNEIKPVNLKRNQLWIFIGRTDAKVETPILWPPNVKNWLIEKTLMLGKIEGVRRRGQQRMRWLDGITDSMDMSLPCGHIKHLWTHLIPFLSRPHLSLLTIWTARESSFISHWVQACPVYTIFRVYQSHAQWKSLILMTRSS